MMRIEHDGIPMKICRDHVPHSGDTLQIVMHDGHDHSVAVVLEISCDDTSTDVGHAAPVIAAMLSHGAFLAELDLGTRAAGWRVLRTHRGTPPRGLIYATIDHATYPGNRPTVDRVIGRPTWILKSVVATLGVSAESAERVRT